MSVISWSTMPVDPELHVVASTLGRDQRGVDPVEVVVRDDDRRDAGAGRSRRRPGGWRSRPGRGGSSAWRSSWSGTLERRRSSRRRPRTPATVEATAIAPAWIRKPVATSRRRRDRGPGRRRARRAVPGAASACSRKRQRLDAGDGGHHRDDHRGRRRGGRRRRAAASEPDERRTPPKPAAATVNDQPDGDEPEERRRSPRAMTTISVSRASLSFVPKRLDDDVLGAGRLVVDHELADRGEQRRRRRGSPATSSDSPIAASTATAPAIGGRRAVATGHGDPRPARRGARRARQVVSLIRLEFFVAIDDDRMSDPRCSIDAQPPAGDGSGRSQPAEPREIARRRRAASDGRAPAGAARATAALAASPSLTNRTAIAGPELAEDRQVGRDHDRHHPVAARRLVVGGRGRSGRPSDGTWTAPHGTPCVRVSPPIPSGSGSSVEPDADPVGRPVATRQSARRRAPSRPGSRARAGRGARRAPRAAVREVRPARRRAPARRAPARAWPAPRTDRGERRSPGRSGRPSRPPKRARRGTSSASRARAGTSIPPGTAR